MQKKNKKKKNNNNKEKTLKSEIKVKVIYSFRNRLISDEISFKVE